MTKFSSKLWQDNAAIFTKITAMPFITEMIQGNLAVEKFKHYIIQDAYYLIDYSRALSIASAKADNKDNMIFYSKTAHDSLVVERSLHEDYMSLYNITTEDYHNTPVMPTTTQYCNFLKITAWEESYAVGIAALLPCFWIYAQVGRYISSQNIADNNPYTAWIQTYADEEFWTVCEQAIATVDLAAKTASSEELKKMTAAYARSSLLEWMFWDASYRLESWPK